MIVAYRLRTWRQRRAMSLTTLSAATGLNWSVLRNIESGRRAMSVDEGNALARALGVDPREIAEFPTEEKRLIRSYVRVDAQPLRVLRTARNMTCTDLARASRVARRSITAIENGEEAPFPETARRLAQALGVEPLAIAEYAASRRHRPRTQMSVALPANVPTLRMWRHTVALSLSETARLVGYSVSYLRKIENRSMQPSLDALEEIAFRFGIEPPMIAEYAALANIPPRPVVILARPLRAWRRMRRLRYDALARRADVDEMLIRQIEAGDVGDVDASAWTRLARALGVRPAQIAERRGVHLIVDDAPPAEETIAIPRIPPFRARRRKRA